MNSFLSIIDHNLWYNAKIIWQDDLAAILKDAWKGRKTPPPEKPIVEIENKLRVSNAINPVSSHINPVSNPINTQIKGNETKVDKNKLSFLATALNTYKGMTKGILGSLFKSNKILKLSSTNCSCSTYYYISKNNSIAYSIFFRAKIFSHSNLYFIRIFHKR